MPLPILNVSQELSPLTLLRYFLQSERHWTAHFAEEAALDCGAAYANPQLSLVRDANRIIDAMLPPDTSAPQVFDQVTQHYAALGATCRQWLMNPSAPPERTEPISSLLLERGYQRQAEDILYLEKLPSHAIREVPDLKIIPARASFRHARALSEQMVAGFEPALARQLVEGAMLHLDDSHYDALLALKDGQAIAKVGVLAVGEIGRIEPLLVLDGFRRQGIGRTMMSRALEICARSLFKHIFLSCAPDNERAQALYRMLGFKKVGEMVAYFAPSD